MSDLPHDGYIKALASAKKLIQSAPTRREIDFDQGNVALVFRSSGSERHISDDSDECWLEKAQGIIRAELEALLGVFEKYEGPLIRRCPAHSGVSAISTSTAPWPDQDTTRATTGSTESPVRRTDSWAAILLRSLAVTGTMNRFASPISV
jgi:hypothetical protein